MKPDMVKAMELAKETVAEHGGCDIAECTHSEQLLLASALLALPAEHEALKQAVLDAYGCFPPAFTNRLTDKGET